MSSMVLLRISAMKIIMPSILRGVGRVVTGVLDAEAPIQSIAFNEPLPTAPPSCRRVIDRRAPVAPGVWQQGISSWRGVHAVCHGQPSHDRISGQSAKSSRG